MGGARLLQQRQKKNRAKALERKKIAAELHKFKTNPDQQNQQPEKNHSRKFKEITFREDEENFAKEMLALCSDQPSSIQSQQQEGMKRRENEEEFTQVQNRNCRRKKLVEIEIVEKARKQDKVTLSTSTMTQRKEKELAESWDDLLNEIRTNYSALPPTAVPSPPPPTQAPSARRTVKEIVIEEKDPSHRQKRRNYREKLDDLIIRDYMENASDLGLDELGKLQVSLSQTLDFLDSQTKMEDLQEESLKDPNFIAFKTGRRKGRGIVEEQEDDDDEQEEKKEKKKLGRGKGKKKTIENVEDLKKDFGMRFQHGGTMEMNEKAIIIQGKSKEDEAEAGEEEEDEIEIEIEQEIEIEEDEDDSIKSRIDIEGLNDTFRMLILDDRKNQFEIFYELNDKEKQKINKLAAFYNLHTRLGNTGSGGQNRSLIISKTSSSCLPANTKQLQIFIRSSTKWKRMKNKQKNSDPFSKPSSSSSRNTLIADPIPQNNIGFKLLSKSGWNGGGLGASKQGIVDPIAVTIKKNRLGLGF